MIVKIENQCEEQKFGKIINELKPNNSEFKKILTELQEYIACALPEELHDDQIDKYLKNPYPIAISLRDCNGKETNLQNAVNWEWRNKFDLEWDKDIHCVSVSEFEEMFCGGFEITLEYFSQLTVAGKTPRVTVVDEEDGDASVEWEFKNENGKHGVCMNVSRSGKNDNWNLFFVYCADPYNHDIDLDVVLTDKEEFVKLFSFVSARMEKIVKSWENE